MNCYSTRYLMVVASMLTALSACSGDGGSGSNTFGAGSPFDDTSNSDTPRTSEDCTYVLQEHITSPTRLENTGSNCDYLIDRSISVNSLLTIEPGTVIRSTPDRTIRIDGGELQAVGTTDQRIVFEGLASVQGYWGGIDVIDALDVVFDYVDIKDAGQDCSIVFCADVAMEIDNTEFSFTNSSVSNSKVSGMAINDGTIINRFSNNRFLGNGEHGLEIDHDLIPMLDMQSDFYGLEVSNGIPTIRIYSGDLELSEDYVWKALNAPYFIDGFLNIENGLLVLEAGVDVIFDEGAWMTVSRNGVLNSNGTVDAPVVFKGAVEQPGYWDGLSIRDTHFPISRINNTIFSHSGEDDGLAVANAALRVDESTVFLNNVTFEDNARWGIFCTEPSSVTQASVLVDLGGNMFRNNGRGDVSANCSIRDSRL